MKKLIYGILAPLAALAILVTSAVGQGNGNAAKGKQEFMAYSCYACHGFSGQNGPGTRLVPMKMPQVVFTAYVRNPRQMPPYTAKVVPDRELADIWTYLQTLPRSPAAKDIPLLNQILAEK